MELQDLDQGIPQLAAGHHLIHKAVLHLELAALESGGQFFTDGLLNDTGPAKPMSAPGSASMISPRLAKLAVTPPVVGWVSTLTYSPPFAEKRWIAALVLAICIRLKMPSCIRAPPLAEKMTRGRRLAVAYSTARVILSPTAVLMLPIKNRLSNTAATQATPPMRPTAVTAASCRPVLFWAAASFFPVSGEVQHILRIKVSVQFPEAAVIQHQTEPVIPANGHVVAAVGADVKASCPQGACGAAAALLALHKLRLVPDGTGIPLGLQLESALPHPVGEQISDIIHRMFPQICAVM